MLRIMFYCGKVLTVAIEVDEYTSLKKIFHLSQKCITFEVRDIIPTMLLRVFH